MIHVGEGEGRVEGEVEGYVHVCTVLLHASRGRSDIGKRIEYICAYHYTCTCLIAVVLIPKLLMYIMEGIDIHVCIYTCARLTNPL